MADEETVLGGGNMTEVVRVGDTVRRTVGPWSSTIHDLLRYLEKHEFEAAPRVLGIDDKGREILTFIKGEVGKYPLPYYMWSDAVLEKVARLLRRFHDLTTNYIPSDNAIWQFSYPDTQQHEIICHNDFAPYNMVFVKHQPKAIIDFDTAGPGPRVWDQAYAAYCFVPLVHFGDTALQQLGLTDHRMQARRLLLFCESYGSITQPQEVLDMVRPRLQALCTLIQESAEAGHSAFQKQIEEGHLAMYQRELQALRWYYPRLQQNIERL